MQKKCSNPNCLAPKGLCEESMSQEYQTCPHWNETSEEIASNKTTSKSKAKIIPWNGLPLQPDEIELLAHRSSPTIIGMIGAVKAGKTSYLGMLYTMLFNGRTFNNWDFAGSYTLIAWENQAKYLKVKPNGKVDYAPSTPSNPDFYSLYHLALQNETHLHDILFADSSGEVFTKWANKVDDPNAQNARWIYKHSNAFIFFIDSEAVSLQKGVAKRSITQLAEQVAANLNDRPIIVVWSKADKLEGVLPNIKEAIEEVIAQNFPNAITIQISNYSKKDPDTLCHINNLKVTELILNKLINIRSSKLVPSIGETSDFFFNYKGGYENQ